MGDIVKKKVVLVAKEDVDMYDVFEKKIPIKRGDKLEGEYIKYVAFENITVWLNGFKAAYVADYFDNLFIMKEV